MEEIIYSYWHRKLGYSYFAMDLDFIEVRDNIPVAVIETSLCTWRHDECHKVFNRFLGETGGFQFEVAYWCAKWLNVPAFIVCDDNIGNFKSGSPLFNILSLNTGELKRLSKAEYQIFLNELPEYKKFFSGKELTLHELLEKFGKDFVSMNKYPYFNKKNREKWQEDYELRCKEIDEGIQAKHLKKVSNTQNIPIKGETTGERVKDYIKIRNTMSGDYFNLEWVEWRKEDKGQKIGRPHGLIKTIGIKANSDKEYVELSESAYRDFIKTKEKIWWDEVANRMKVDWYFVAYKNNVEKFFVYDISNNGKKYSLSEEKYMEWMRKF